jgi:3-phenylpropionate/cinnamic acid dioxygenase small subunit
MMTAELRGHALRAAIEDLLFDYASTLDESMLERWPDFFTEDALYEVISQDNVEQDLRLALLRCEGKGMILDRMIALKDVLFYAPRRFRRFIANVRATLRSDGTIAATSSFLVLPTLVEQPTEILVAGRYHDIVVADGDQLKFRVKRCIYDTTLIPNTLVYPI